MDNNIEKILLSESEISETVRSLANTLNSFYNDSDEVILVGILKGCISFYADLARHLTFPVRFEFMCVSSYGAGTQSTGMLRIDKDLTLDISGRDVLIIEDILDSGNTLFQLKKLLLQRGADDLKLCCLLDKPSRRRADITAGFVGKTIEDEFVVGYGLDYNEQCRQLPYIGVLKRCIYEK